VASPNPEGDKSKDSASIKDEDRPENQKQRARKTQGFGAREPPPTAERAAADKRNAQQYPLATLISQWLTTIFTGLAFAAAAVYADYAMQQVRQTIASNHNAISALHVSERAYITADAPVLDPMAKFATMSINNLGHIPCPHSQIVAHEATFNISLPNVAPLFGDVVEVHWKSYKGPIPPGKNIMSVVIKVPAFSQSKFTPEGEDGFQEIAIAGLVIYEDGFADDGPQKWKFCFSTLYQLNLRTIFWTPCDADTVLPNLEALDRYPNNEQKN
jgi:hypothetical protein